MMLVLLLAAATAQVYTEPEAAAVEAVAAAGEAVEEAGEAVEEAGEAVEEAANELMVEEEEDAEETVSEEASLVEEAAPEEAMEETVEEAADGEATDVPPESLASSGPSQQPYSESADPTTPACSLNSSKPWCLADAEYPEDRIKQAVSYHHYSLLTLYQDLVADTANSVDRLNKLKEESYLCGSTTSYVQPLRAVNTDGRWRVIVNGIKVHYDTFTQTVRLEECQAAGQPCPLVPECYDSSCLQQSAVQRLLVYDDHDYYQPFAVETFRLPSACACALGAYEISH